MNWRALLAAVLARAALQVGIGILLANVLMPSLMTAIGISELKLGMVVKAMFIASAGTLLVGLVACGVPARGALRIPGNRSDEVYWLIRGSAA